MTMRSIHHVAGMRKGVENLFSIFFSRFPTSLLGDRSVSFPFIYWALSIFRILRARGSSTIGDDSKTKKFSLLASRCGWLGPARARAVGVREECGRSANGAVTRRAVASTSGAAGGAVGGAVTRQARLGRLGSLGGPAMPPSLRLRSNEAAGMRLMRAWLRLIR